MKALGKYLIDEDGADRSGGPGKGDEAAFTKFLRRVWKRLPCPASELVL
jgi:hypothetical protein